MESGAFRKKKVYFSQVSNSALRDKGLSLKAKGLYALIQSYITIEGFTLYKSMLMKECRESKTAFDSAWKELIDSGYLMRHKVRAEGGMFCYEYELLDTKEVKNAEKPDDQPHPQNRGLDNRGTENMGLYNNTNRKNTDLSNTEKNNTPTSINSVGGDVSDEVNEFVCRTYPHMYWEAYGEQHSKLNPVQRIRTKQILQNYLDSEGETVESLECAAEEFLDSTPTDGNIRAFADPMTINIMLCRLGFRSSVS